MKVVCVSKSYELDSIIDYGKNLTIGKTYDVIKTPTPPKIANSTYGFPSGMIPQTYIKIIDDVGGVSIYPYNLFVTLEEYRNAKIIELGI